MERTKIYALSVHENHINLINEIVVSPSIGILSVALVFMRDIPSAA